MIYTGYFANMRNYTGVCISVARYKPKGVNCLEAPMFFPPHELISNWKNGTISKSEYEKIYTREVLNRIDLDYLKKSIDYFHEDITFLCYEKPSSFCHRHIISKWLNDLGIPCKEREF